MRILRIILKSFLWILAIPLTYLLVAIILSFITQNELSEFPEKGKIIYLSSNGVHLDIILPIDQIDTNLLMGINRTSESIYISFGWGDKDFYLNTPTWGDLTASTAFSAMILNSETLIHLTRHKSVQHHWVAIKVNAKQIEKVNKYLKDSFVFDNAGNIILLKNKGYGHNDDFYKAKGSYSCFHTCNSWVNKALSDSDLACCLWTPFDFAVLNIYKK